MTSAVITGMGLVSPYGFGVEAFRRGLHLGRSAVGTIQSFDVSTCPTQVAAEVPIKEITTSWMQESLSQFPGTFSLPKESIPEGVWRDRKVGFALLAAAEAWSNAGYHSPDPRGSLSLALGLEQALLEDFAPHFDSAINWERAFNSPEPGIRFRSSADLAAKWVNRLLKLEGPSVVHLSACAAGTLAIGHAASLIERGSTELVITGGADSMVNPLGLGGMSRLGAPSPRNCAEACRPFDLRRDGLAMGEGAAVFVVESHQRALKRGAPILAEIAGWGSTQDGYRITAPRPDGSMAAKAMTLAMEKAGIAPHELDYINAHGTGTPLNDPAECEAIHRALGEAAPRVPVSSIKGAVGHLMAAAGAIEAAACLIAIEDQIIPGTTNLQSQDPRIPLKVIGPEPEPATIRHVLSNSFGFGGQNATIVLRKVS